MPGTEGEEHTVFQRGDSRYIVAPELHKTAGIGDKGSLDLRPEGVEYAYRDGLVEDRIDCRRVYDLGAECTQVHALHKRHLRYDSNSLTMSAVVSLVSAMFLSNHFSVLIKSGEW